MAKRLDPSWIVLESLENAQHNRCADVFTRPDGSFGFEEFRRDPEEAGVWTPVRYFSGLRYTSKCEAMDDAAWKVAWLAEDPAQSSQSTYGPSKAIGLSLTKGVLGRGEESIAEHYGPAARMRAASHPARYAPDT